MIVCPNCGHHLDPPGGEQGATGLRERLLEALGAAPEGLTTRELQPLGCRRFSTTEAALAILEAEGLVERDPAGEGRAWRARRWRLPGNGSGATSVPPQGARAA